VQLNSTYLLTYLHAGANNTVYLGDYLTRPASQPAGEAAVAVKVPIICRQYIVYRRRCNISSTPFDSFPEAACACVYERSGILTSARAHEKKSPPMIARLTNISGGSDLFRVGEAGGRRALSVVEAVVAAALAGGPFASTPAE